MPYSLPPIAYTPEMYAAAETALRESRTPAEIIQDPTPEEDTSRLQQGVAEGSRMSAPPNNNRQSLPGGTE
jgi:hypothetical protein